jgi:hypothetical protein
LHKAPLPAEQPVRTRAIVTKVHSAVTLNTATGVANPNYRVIIGNNVYWATGVGPSAGIYDVEVYKNFIHVNIEHMNAKPIEIYHLHIDLVQYDQADSIHGLVPSTPQPEIVDGRRLIIYDTATDQAGNVHLRAVAVNRKTGKETYFIISGYTPGILPGIYDFNLATVEHQTYLDLLTDPKGIGPTWIRLGVDASCAGCNPVDPMFDKQNYR